MTIQTIYLSSLLVNYILSIIILRRMGDVRIKDLLWLLIGCAMLHFIVPIIGYITDKDITWDTVIIKGKK